VPGPRPGAGTALARHCDTGYRRGDPFGLRQSHLSGAARFTAHTGVPPIRYLIQARVDRARDLLTETNMSVTQVAAMLGYPDIAYFSRQYKRYTGHPPGERP
jgi:transcriptional regulator GlxA family with amidase domain